MGITTLVSVPDIVAFVKDRNEPMAKELEMTLADKMFDLGQEGKATFTHFTNNPVLAGIEDDVEVSDSVFFLRLLKPSNGAVKAGVETAVEVQAFYVINFHSLNISDQTANIT